MKQMKQKWIRKCLTDVLLSVTNEMIQEIATQVMNECKHKVEHVASPSSSTNLLGKRAPSMSPWSHQSFQVLVHLGCGWLGWPVNHLTIRIHV